MFAQTSFPGAGSLKTTLSALTLVMDLPLLGSHILMVNCMYTLEPLSGDHTAMYARGGPWSPLSFQSP